MFNPVMSLLHGELCAVETTTTKQSVSTSSCKLNACASSQLCDFDEVIISHTLPINILCLKHTNSVHYRYLQHISQKLLAISVCG